MARRAGRHRKAAGRAQGVMSGTCCVDYKGGKRAREEVVDAFLMIESNRIEC